VKVPEEEESNRELLSQRRRSEGGKNGERLGGLIQSGLIIYCPEAANMQCYNIRPRKARRRNTANKVNGKESGILIKEYLFERTRYRIKRWDGVGMGRWMKKASTATRRRHDVTPHVRTMEGNGDKRKANKPKSRTKGVTTKDLAWWFGRGRQFHMSIPGVSKS